MSITPASPQNIYRHFIACGQKVCTDTRKIEEGALFFALKGDNFDGNLFAEKAIEGGCAFAVVSDPAVAKSDRYLLVNDALKSLQDLARHHRSQFSIPVLAITGSNGKTTTKELVNSVLAKKYRTLATVGNLNNHIGVPLTLLKLDTTHEFAIIEMGANHQGEINALCEIALPGYGIVTNVGKAHLEGFGGIEGVKKGKGELYRFLEKNKGIAFVHADDPVLMDMAGTCDKITYGTTKLFDVVGKPGATDGLVEFRWKTRYTASSLSTATPIKTNLVGKYNYYNLLCSACVGNYFHVSEHDINAALAEYKPSNNRSQLYDSGRNRIILDMYNANPTSMTAAIDNFGQMNAENKVIILGDMLELGEDAAREHEGILKLLQEKKFGECYLVGPLFYACARVPGCKHFKNASEAAAYFKTTAPNNRTILLKGSRGIKLEELLPCL